MRCALCLLMGSSLLGWVGPVRAASLNADAAQVHLNRIRLNVDVHSTLLAGSLIICKAEAVLEGGSPPSDAQPSLAGSATLHGPSGVCAIEIPLCWTGRGIASSLEIRYEIDAAPRPGDPVVLLRRGTLTAALLDRMAGSSPRSLTLDVAP